MLHDFEPRVVFDLEPADAVTVTTLMDNVTDVLMPDQAPAYRPPRFAGGRRPAATMEGGDALEALVAEHGFSVLTKGRPLYTVMGGFHLGGPIFEPLIPRVLDDLGALMPSVIVPGPLHRMASPACPGRPVRRGIRPQHRRHRFHL